MTLGTTIRGILCHHLLESNIQHLMLAYAHSKKHSPTFMKTFQIEGSTKLGALRFMNKRCKNYSSEERCRVGCFFHFVPPGCYTIFAKRGCRWHNATVANKDFRFHMTPVDSCDHRCNGELVGSYNCIFTTSTNRTGMIGCS